MTKRVKIAVLVDLPRESSAGGHVKYWEHVARAASRSDLPLDLTVYFSGSGAEEILAPHVRYRFLPPVFSTSRLKFLPYVPAHTDLASFHSGLADELPTYDVLHTTDAYFAFARTAERMAGWYKKLLVTSFHTDTPAYAELFTRQTLHHIFGLRLGSTIDRLFKLPAKERAKKENRLVKHLRKCDAILAMRSEDKALAASVTSAGRIRHMRLGVDKDLFHPKARDRLALEHSFHIPSGRFKVLFVGRVDAGKNIPLLADACLSAIKSGALLHLVVAGVGPLQDEVKRKLGPHVSLLGWVDAPVLAQLYASVDVLAMASDIEIGGMIAVEALASGCPVLVSAQSGVARLLGDPAAMLTVPSQGEAWSETLTSLAEDRQRQDKMRESALAFGQASLASWDEVLSQDFWPVWSSNANSINT